jgi:NAD(P)-dependent dehydrogenase (short-subunit alcohol dehydrogenase family)
MTATLITGANKGLGFETARQLIAAGHTVYVGSRDRERGRLAAQQLGARTVQLDVTDDASADAAVKAIEADGGLNVLVNNAGIAEEWRSDHTDNVVIGAAEVTADLMQRTFDTNVFGTMRRPSAALGVATPGSSLCSSVGTLINHIADVEDRGNRSRFRSPNQGLGRILGARLSRSGHPRQSFGEPRVMSASRGRRCRCGRTRRMGRRLHAYWC